MAYNALNNLIDAYIYANGVQAITGQILNGVLKQMVSQLGSGYHLMGVAGPETVPASNDYAMAYFAATAGEYTDFGGITLTAGEVAVLLTSGNGSWEKQTIYNVPTGTADLENTADFITNAVTDLVNYYTKTEVDDTLANYPTLEDLATALADYYTKTEIDTTLADYATKDGVDETLADYYDKDEVDAEMGDRYTKSEVDTKLSDYYRKAETYDKDEVDSIVAALNRQEYVVAWNGTTTPDVSTIPAGVTVTYSGTTYTGTMAASASTVNKIYMVWNGTAYDMYTTSQDGGYSWVPMGTTTVDLSQYATKDEVSQLEHKVDDLEQVVGTTDKSINLTVDKTGYYVYNDGRLMTSASFNLSSPVHLKRGERIAVRTAAWEVVAVIAKILESGSTPYQALVNGSSSGTLVEDDFSYTATEECDVVISGYVSQFPATAILTYASTIATLVDTVGQLDEDMEIVKSERVLDFKDETVTVTISETGMAVKDDGTVVLSSNFNISAPIKIRRGQKITVAASGWTSIAIIAKVLPSGYMPLVLGTSSGSLVNDTFTYVATEDCNIVITSYVNYYPATAGLSFSNTVISQQSALIKLGGATAIPVNPVRGGWYNTYGDGTVGSIATLEYTENIDWESLNILVNAGDVFYVTGRGGNSPRLWAFLDATTNEILAFSGHVTHGNKDRIVAPKDCRLVINIQILLAQPYGIWKEQADFGSIRNIENFSRLNTLPSIPIDKIDYFDGFAGIIHHWGFIGDSLMSGFFDNTGASNYEYSWGQRMCKKLGVEGYNFSRGGQTVKGWIEDASSQDPVFFNRSWGGAKTNLKQAYIIGLGVNDKVESYGVGDVSTDVGTYDPTTDTDTNANTYAGYYAGIIQRVRSVQPNAPIFLVNMPQGGGWNSVVPYNEVIADLVAEFDNTYLIDLFSSLPIFGTYHYETSKFWTGGHLNPAGYEYIASVIMQYLDWIIRNNYAAFASVNLIPFTE